jgi:hypothetical protein
MFVIARFDKHGRKFNDTMPAHTETRDAAASAEFETGRFTLNTAWRQQE